MHVALSEPANYSTDWSGAPAVRPSAVGVPSATREAILAIVDAEEPPLRIFFGRNMLEQATTEYQQRIAGWEA